MQCYDFCDQSAIGVRVIEQGQAVSLSLNYIYTKGLARLQLGIAGYLSIMYAKCNL